LAPSLIGEESLHKLKKNLVSGSGFGSSSKSNQFVLITHPTYPPNFIQIHQQLFELSCTQTNKQKDVVQSTILARYTPFSKGCHGYNKLSISLRLKLTISIKAQANRMKIDYFSNLNLMILEV